MYSWYDVSQDFINLINVDVDVYKMKFLKIAYGTFTRGQGVPIVQYSEQNRVIFNTPRTGFISNMTYFAKQDHP